MCVNWGSGLQISGQIAGVTCGPFPVLASLHLGEFHSHLCLSKIKSIVHVFRDYGEQSLEGKNHSRSGSGRAPAALITKLMRDGSQGLRWLW